MLPPYETEDALARLDADIQLTRAQTVVCLGDSFDDLIAAESLTEAASLWITRLQAGRRWIWIEGNHDAGPTGLAGSHLSELAAPPLTFRHITRERTHGEISGHYHPKATVQARGRTISRACFLYDEDRLILPTYGTYTGGLLCTSQPLSSLMSPKAHAILTGTNPVCIPIPRDRGARP